MGALLGGKLGCNVRGFGRGGFIGGLFQLAARPFHFFTIAAQLTPGSAPSLPLAADSADFTWTAADQANDGNDTPHTGREIILVRNDNVGAQTVTVHSIADPYNREGDIAAYSLAAGDYAAFGPFQGAAWRQTDGKLWFNGSAADVFFAVLRLA